MTEPFQSHDQEALEQRIAGLAGAVKARPNHRQRFLQQANEAVDEDRSKRHSTRVIVGLSMAVVLASPWLGQLSELLPSSPPTAEQVQTEALERAHNHNTSLDWALADLFAAFRESRRPRDPSR